MPSLRTTAAIEAGNIVLTDNDFATIVAAIEGGRTVYRNIVRFIRFLLAANTGEVLVFALAIALGLSAPLTVFRSCSSTCSPTACRRSRSVSRKAQLEARLLRRTEASRFRQ